MSLTDIVQKQVATIAKLENTLNKQSVCLAEALCRKNDLIAQAQASDRLIANIQAANRNLCDREGQLKEGLESAKNELRQVRDNVPIRHLHLSLPHAVAAMQVSERVALDNVNRLEEELRKLKPAEPKFRVNQVLIHSSGNAFKVRHRKLNPHLKAWEYSNRRTAPEWNEWTLESQLRALNDEEK